MIASGKRLSDIAEELMLSPKTVSVYRARVLEKLQLANNSELTVYAIRNGSGRTVTLRAAALDDPVAIRRGDRR
jgi:DNA-binding NarL/FixJ family response regulator